MITALRKSAFSIAGVSQRTMLNLTTRRFAQWAHLDRWLAGMSADERANMATNETYKKYAVAEADYWANPAVGDEADIHDNPYHASRSPALKQYIRQTVMGDFEGGVADYIASFGPFRRALVLSHFTHLVECLKRGVAESWTFNDYAGRFKPQEHTDAPFRVIRQDLNFAELGEKQYDLVIVDSLLHHLINIEDLIHKISRCLVSGGHLVIPLDYCGERRFWWGSKHREQMDRILSDIPLRHLRYPLCSASAIHFSPISPFEAVSGPELPKLLDSKFQTIRFKASHGILFPVLAYLKKDLLETDNSLVDKLLEADESVPGSFFSAVYRLC